ncbi:hypothetical protein [Phenylobacterium sp.]|uniref:hypothetical protein n=1 Tax=Phenylobacterium sp. TaxID=1871053 RepID=UPI002DECB6A6|nr:hypothetical protein [Phenylobacterium sp.]
MRKMLGAAVIGLTAIGGAVIVSGAQAQPYGYYSPPPAGYYDNGYYHPAPTYNGYYTAPAYGYNDPAAVAGALIGSVIAPAYGSAVPVDRFGPDPNGMIAPDGHRIKCKLRTGYTTYGRYRTFRECD